MGHLFSKRWLGFELAHRDVGFHQVVEQHLGTSTNRIKTANRSVRAQGLVGCFVKKVAVFLATVALEPARKCNNSCHLFLVQKKLNFLEFYVRNLHDS